MGVWVTEIPCEARWAIRSDDASLLPLDVASGLCILNPLAANSSLDQGLPPIIVESRVLLVRKHLHLVLQDDRDLLPSAISFILTALRWASRQAELPRTTRMWKSLYIENVPTPVFPRPHASQLGAVVPYNFRTALSADTIRRAGTQPPGWSPPAHEAHLLDSIEFYVKNLFGNDFDRVVEHCGVAIELAARHAIIKAGQQLKGKSKLEQLLDRLSERSLGRSLKDCNPDLYRAARRVYHRRRSPGLHTQLRSGTTTESDALEALRTACATVHWFAPGEPEFWVPDEPDAKNWVKGPVAESSPPGKSDA